MALSAIVFHFPLCNSTLLPHCHVPDDSVKKEKKEKLAPPVDNMLFTCDIILANTLVRSFQDDWCQTVFNLVQKKCAGGFLWRCYNPLWA